MPFRLEKTPVDLHDTPVENLFLDLYMPPAPGDFVKVYLLGYRYALEASEGKRFTSRTIATNLNLPLQQVLKAWQYWEDKGLVRLTHPAGSSVGFPGKPPTESPNDDAGGVPGALPSDGSGSAPEDAPLPESSVEFLSLKTLHLKHTPQVTSSAVESETPPPHTTTPAELLEANERESFRQFFAAINRLMQRPLVPNEEMQVLDWLHHFKVEKTVVLMAFEYAVRQKEVRSVPYVAGIVRNWADEGFLTGEQVQAFLDRMQLRYRQYDQVFKALGFHGRLPSDAESRLMDQWLDAFGFSMDMIIKACGFSAGTAKPSIKYIHGILDRWQKEGLTTPEAVDRHEADRRQQATEKAGAKDAGRRVTSPPVKKTGFHLPESRGKDYSNDELEKILLGRKRRPRKEDDQ
ncbi:DnaD domain protein [Anoxynatronum sibiricum]|uniref:DnaD domain protein n=1 Tax=Anoxynatronum sibiricum TaxID=210623 RepID=A0ABU9VSS5_9CLOT